MSAYMVGEAVRRHPGLAAEVVRRGFATVPYTAHLNAIVSHDFAGHASRVRVLDRVLTRLREREGVWWARKDQLADWILAHPETAAWVERDPAPVSGLPGSSA